MSARYTPKRQRVPDGAFGQVKSQKDSIYDDFIIMHKDTDYLASHGSKVIAKIRIHPLYLSGYAENEGNPSQWQGPVSSHNRWKCDNLRFAIKNHIPASCAQDLFAIFVPDPAREISDLNFRKTVESVLNSADKKNCVIIPAGQTKYITVPQTDVFWVDHHGRLADALASPGTIWVGVYTELQNAFLNYTKTNSTNASLLTISVQGKLSFFDKIMLDDTTLFTQQPPAHGDHDDTDASPDDDNPDAEIPELVPILHEERQPVGRTQLNPLPAATVGATNTFFAQIPALPADADLAAEASQTQQMINSGTFPTTQRRGVNDDMNPIFEGPALMLTGNAFAAANKGKRLNLSDVTKYLKVMYHKVKAWVGDHIHSSLVELMGSEAGDLVYDLATDVVYPVLSALFTGGLLRNTLPQDCYAGPQGSGYCYYKSGYPLKLGTDGQPIAVDYLQVGKRAAAFGQFTAYEGQGWLIHPTIGQFYSLIRNMINGVASTASNAATREYYTRIRDFEAAIRSQSKYMCFVGPPIESRDLLTSDNIDFDSFEQEGWSGLVDYDACVCQGNTVCLYPGWQEPEIFQTAHYASQRTTKNVRDNVTSLSTPGIPTRSSDPLPITFFVKVDDTTTPKIYVGVKALGSSSIFWYGAIDQDTNINFLREIMNRNTPVTLANVGATPPDNNEDATSYKIHFNGYITSFGATSVDPVTITDLSDWNDWLIANNSGDPAIPYRCFTEMRFLGNEIPLSAPPRNIDTIGSMLEMIYTRCRTNDVTHVAPGATLTLEAIPDQVLGYCAPINPSTLEVGDGSFHRLDGYLWSPAFL